MIEEEIKRGDDLENERSDDSPQTIDTEECEEIVINVDDDDDIEHPSNEEAEIEYENHSDYSDIMRESETLDEMDCSIISESNLSDAVNLTMDSVTATERRLEKQVFPEADHAMQEIEQFIQASPVVKHAVPRHDGHDNHDQSQSLPSPVPTISKSSIPTKVITPTRVVSREKICERADQASPKSILSSTPARSPSPTGPVPPPTPVSPLATRSRCPHPGITTHIRLPRKYVKDSQS